MSDSHPELSKQANLNTPLTVLRGVGPNLQRKLSRLKLHTIEDLLYFLPYRYEDRRQLLHISQVKVSTTVQFLGKILSADEVRNGRGRKKVFEMLVSDGSGQILLKWFHYRHEWMKQRYRKGQQLLVVGEVHQFKGRYEILHPELELCSDGNIPIENLRILPVYPLTEGISQKQMRKLCQQVALEYSSCVVTAIPQHIIKRRGLLTLADSLVKLHIPPSDSEIEQLQSGRDVARKTVVFDEFFYLQLGLALRRLGAQFKQGIAFKVNHLYTKPLVDMLPFKLTQAQRSVLSQIKHDMMSEQQMNRLVQGDVGSGKTIVALLACLIAVENKTQAAVVAPTAILAEQHFQQFNHWLSQLGLSAALLTGATTSAERQHILRQLSEGTLDVLVGTHALLQPDVVFHCLGLGIIDEQHRFGVQQRNDLRKKGENADILVMTATPIPRTLSMTVYGDLSLSVIDQLPPGRTPIKTRVVSTGKRSAVLDFVKRELDKGYQGYFVYPLVEESERSDLKAATDSLDTLQRDLGNNYRLGLLHGRLRPHEKEAVMQQFKQHQIDLLVATTVIEVGIDVPNASLMIVEHAERFGLAQLHQLRGRVGRGSAKSYCILVHSDQCGQEGMQRLQVMENNSDGFKIAEADLAQRGPGEFLGTKQAGMVNFKVANLISDGYLLEMARQDAFELVEQPNFIKDKKYKLLLQILHQRWDTRLELANVG
ncbi:MAG: ATP-dependent DNA helicase RecG [Desulfobacteraceae bacterium 4572_35.1]|nr:MAG: ATP-dependent DNA helicase RecG [Desulfobacteraceae bacterium 4572_35.1]